MNLEWIKKYILLILATILFVGSTLYYCIAGTTFASVLYFILLMIVLGLIFVHFVMNRTKK